MPYVFNLNRILSCHTLSKALEMSRETLITSIVGSQSKDEFISWTIDNDCKIHESSVRKPHWRFFKSWWRWLKSSLRMILLYILPKIGRRLIGLEFFRRFLLSFLWIGTTLAFFQQSGKTPSWMDALKMSFKG